MAQTELSEDAARLLRRPQRYVARPRIACKLRRSQIHTYARTTSTISVAEDAADGNGINKLVQQYRSDCETIQHHGIWTVIRFSRWPTVYSDICTSVDFTGDFSRAKFPQGRSVGRGIMESTPCPSLAITLQQHPRMDPIERKLQNLAESCSADCLRKNGNARCAPQYGRCRF